MSVTTGFAAIAETGTLVMTSGPDHPVSLNLLPDTHVVVLREADIVSGYEDVWQRLRARYGKDALPRTVTGKLDRRALPAPPERARTRPRPRSDAEHVVAEVWADLLRSPDIGVDDDFFALGGDSILGAQVTARLRERFAIDLPLRALFDAPTVARLAAGIEQAVLADIETACTEENSWT